MTDDDQQADLSVGYCFDETPESCRRTVDYGERTQYVLGDQTFTEEHDWWYAVAALVGAQYFEAGELDIDPTHCIDISGAKDTVDVSWLIENHERLNNIGVKLTELFGFDVGKLVVRALLTVG